MKQEDKEQARIHWHKICDSLNVLHGLKIARHKDDNMLSLELQYIEEKITENLIELMKLTKTPTKYK